MQDLAKTALAASLVLGSSASAGVADILAAKTRTAAVVVESGAAEPVPLDDKGNKTLVFKTDDKGLVAVTYNAECTPPGGGIPCGLQIIVDGKATDPKASTSDFAFCSGNDEIPTAASRQSLIKVGPGSHSVQVLASLCLLRQSSTLVVD